MNLPAPRGGEADLTADKFSYAYYSVSPFYQSYAI
jgi:hypothetical protein